MFLSLLAGLVNAGLSYLSNRVLGFSGLDISASAVPLLVWHGEHPLFAASVVVLGYSLVDARELRYLWITLPVTILIGYLAGPVPNIYILTLVYHAIGALSAFSLQYFSTKYMMFMLMNIGINFMVARVYGALV